MPAVLIHNAFDEGREGEGREGKGREGKGRGGERRGGKGRGRCAFANLSSMTFN